MADVVVATGGLLPRDPEEFFQHEQACWAYWNGLSAKERTIVKSTVKTELERLLATLDNWLPASGRVNNGVLEITMRINPEDWTDGSTLTRLEQREADEAAASLSDLLAALEEDDAQRP